jgi:toxin ParE1/3/4
MPFTVRLTSDAGRDLRDIVDYIAANQDASAARHVLDRIEQILSTLGESPERGAYPKELLALGIREYREIFFKPYRVVYAIQEGDVFVLLIADGRRDFRTLLSRRLLEG